MSKFKEVVFSESDYQSAKRDQEGYVKDLETLLTVLKDQGAPTSRQFVESISATETALGDWINEEYEKRISTGFVPPVEKKRVNDIYHEIFEILHSPTERVRGLRESGRLPLDEKKGVCAADEKKLEEMAKEAGNKRYDTAKMEEYYQKTSEFIKALTEFEEYEKANGLLPTTRMTSIYSDGLFYEAPPKILTYIQHHPDNTQENFAEWYSKQFIIKK